MKHYLFTKGVFSPVEGLLPSNRGFAYADGFFESVLCLDGKPTFWDLRVHRMRRASEFLKLEALAFDDLHKAIVAVLTEHHHSITRIRLTIYREGEGRYLPETNVPAVLLSVEDLNASPFHNTPARRIGVSTVRLFNSPEGNHKLISKHAQVRAALEAKERGLDDLIMLNTSEEVSELIAGNLFAVIGSEVLTPSLRAGCLDGVARRVLLELPQVKSVRLTMEQIMGADALFGANSVTGVMPLEYDSIAANPELMIGFKDHLESRMY
ncbi:MAG: aminotransferase class IV [Flavobacteriales bacterium]|nr:aminotransferase class IV [Flavobacteriales bacterium]